MRSNMPKPTKPGKYLVIHGKVKNLVEVTKVGRGLSVYCPAYKDRVPMRDIGEDELIWKAVELT